MIQSADADENKNNVCWWWCFIFNWDHGTERIISSSDVIVRRLWCIVDKSWVYGAFFCCCWCFYFLSGYQLICNFDNCFVLTLSVIEMNSSKFIKLCLILTAASCVTWLRLDEYVFHGTLCVSFFLFNFFSLHVEWKILHCNNINPKNVVVCSYFQY